MNVEAEPATEIVRCLTPAAECINLIQMAAPTPPPRPINWGRLSAGDAERLIRQRAADTAKVIFGRHAYARITERGITQPEAYDILRTGAVHEAPSRTAFGDWEAVVEKRMPGGRRAGIVAIVFRKQETLFIKTVEWID